MPERTPKFTPHLTPDQDRAIHTHDRDLVVIAGAGSGKTFVLVERFLALLDANPDLPLNAIAAITFTEKAGAEMRERARSGIQQRVLTAASSEHVARWSARLAAMDSARIGTIHSLCAAILRANAAEAGVDPAFEVLDEVASRLLLEASVDDALSAADDSTRALLSAYDGGGVRSAVLRLATRRTVFDVSAEALFEQWRRDWLAAMQEAYMRLVASPDYVNWAGAIPPDEDTLAVLWRRAVELLDSMKAGDADGLSEGITALSRMIVGNVGKKEAWGDSETVKAARKSLLALRGEAKSLVEGLGELPGDLDAQAAELIPHWAALAGRVGERYSAFKADQRMLDFDDLERLTADLLPREAVRARYAGTEIRYVLVDEFQDTNDAQWRIVQALTAGRPGALFVVGDPKQSIYAFRGADVRVFKRVQQIILDGGGEYVPLAQSFRTHRPLVEGFNGLFRHLLLADSDYAVEFGVDMSAERAAPLDAPHIACLLIEKPPKRKQGEPDHDEEADTREREAAAIAEWIVELVEQQRRPVYDKREKTDRPVRYGDIAILFQAMSYAPTYEAALKAAGIPYVTTAGKGFYDRQEVWDALNLLRAVYNPGDDLAVGSVLRSPFFALSDDALLRMRLEPLPTRPSFWDCLYSVDPGHFSDADRDGVVFARDALTHLRGLAGRVTIGDLLRAAYDYTGYLAILTGLPGGIRLRANAEKLIAIADDSGQIALGAFLAYLDHLKAQEAREGEAVLDAEDAVKLMTVHKSKGLEFPVVVLADTSYRFGGRDFDHAAYDEEIGWSCKLYDEAAAKYVEPYAARRRKALNAAKEDAEKRRLLYVAATRAADHLLISGQVTVGDSLSATGWLGWLIDALELGSLAPDERERLTPAGRIAVARYPYQSGTAERRAGETESAFAWDAIPDSGAEPAAPQIDPIPLDQRAVRDLTASQIADLGAALFAKPKSQRPFFRERWGRGVYGRATAPIPTVSDAPRRSQARLIGDLVHRAIQYGVPDGQCDLTKLLADYAWEFGVVDDADRVRVVERASRLLDSVMNDEVFGWVDTARQVFRELPFVYTTPDRTIHGIIDMLIERADNSWVVVDFKTAFVPDGASRLRVEEHAERYHLQVGVYAAAVEALIGVTPLVVLDYIQHDTRVDVKEPVWRSALDRLESYIGDLFGDQSA